MKKLAFNMANLVGRVTGYRFSLKEWGQQHTLTAQATHEAEWADICSEIANAGFSAVEVWIAHLDSTTSNEAKIRRFGKILADHGLAPVALAGGPDAWGIQVATLLNIPRICGGLWGKPASEVNPIVEQAGIEFNHENHPERSAAEILSKIAGGNDRIGLAIDTGWLATQGVDVPSAVAELMPKIRHVHLKDIVAAGAHETCKLGTGVAKIEETINLLKRNGYKDWYSWEDEPEDRNPFDIAREMREWIERRI